MAKNSSVVRGTAQNDIVQVAPAGSLPQSFEEAVNAWGGEMVELPTEWRLVEKSTLVGEPFFIYGFRFNPGKGPGGRFVSVQLVTEDGRRLVFNDGGAGIIPQLDDYIAREHKMGGILCREGLRVSKYPYTDDKGNTEQTETYYLA